MGCLLTTVFALFAVASLVWLTWQIVFFGSIALVAYIVWRLVVGASPRRGR